MGRDDGQGERAFVQIGELGNAVSELSQMLSQAIVLPFRSPRVGRRAPARAVAMAAGPARTLAMNVRGSLFLASGAVADDALVDLIHRAGGRRARAVVLPAASYSFTGAGERYRRYFQRFGMDRADTLDVSTRARADDPALAASIASADLLVLGGGDPGLLLDVLGGTAAAAAIAGAMVRGAVVAAFGPAATAAGEWALGREEERGERAPSAGGGRRRGLGLLPGTLVATGAHAAGRIAAVFGTALTGGLQALLLDDRAALLVRPGWQAEVRAGTVLAVGGGPVPLRGYGKAQRPEDAPLGGVYTRVAPAGWRLDLAAHVVLPPGALSGAEQP